MRKEISLFLILLILLGTLPFPAVAADSYTYTDTENGNSFVVRSGWVQEDLSMDPLYKVRFSDVKNADAFLQYGSHDVWGKLSQQEQQSIPRDSYDHTQYTPKEIADFLDVKERFVKTVTYSGNTFFQAEDVHANFIFVEVSAIHLVHIRNGWLYLYSFSGNPYSAQYRTFREIVKSTTFPAVESILPTETMEPILPTETMDPILPSAEPVSTTPTFDTTPPAILPIEITPPTVSMDENIYNQAKAAYTQEDYPKAQELFSQISDYLDSSDYLRLLRIRDYGGNIGIGIVYDHGKALTQEQKQDIDSAADNFYFADTARVLLWNVDVATYFLFDDWYTEDGKYLKWHIDSVGGFYYTRSNKLSTAISNTVSIIDGDLRVDINTSNKQVFHMTLTAPDTMELYCYQYDTTYTLTRK